ncbi:MAG: PEP-CTERM sorting domain-containing protein [Cyanobacteria bacterium P01_A01_bin.83]
MKKSSMVVAGATCIALGTVGSARAENTVIDFESLAQPGGGLTRHGFVYGEDGYTLTNNGRPFDFGTFNTGERRYQGSTALFNLTIGGEIVLTKDDGGLFDLLSIDLGELNVPVSTSVSFVGTKSDSTTVEKTFNLDGIFGLETFAFEGFSQLTSVSWTQDSPFHQFDNIVVADSKSTPEPASMLGLLGIAALGTASKLKNKKTKI